jgi:hypothetical protein
MRRPKPTPVAFSLSKKHSDYESAENPADSDQGHDGDRRQYQAAYPVAVHE